MPPADSPYPDPSAAGLPEGARPPASAEGARTPGPFTARPPRGALAWVIPALAASLCLTFIRRFYDGYGSVELTVLGFGLAVFCVRSLLIVLFGRTQAGEAGVRNRLALLTKQLPWLAVKRFEVVPTPFGRKVVVVCTAARIGLAAPREALGGRDPGFDAAVDELARRAREPVRVVRRSSATRLRYPAVVLVAAALIGLAGKPWLEPWWPTRHEATALPDPCGVLDEATARRLVPRARPPVRTVQNLTFSSSAYCRLQDKEDFMGVVVSYRMLKRASGDSGTGLAAKEYTGGVPGGEAVAGLGDEARIRVEPRSAGEYPILKARRANVIVEVEYSGRLPAARMRADTEAVARRALDQIRLS